MADFFGNLKKNLTEVADVVAKKTGEVADVVAKKTEQTVEVTKRRHGPLQVELKVCPDETGQPCERDH